MSTTIESLPPELVTRILSFATLRTVIAASGVSSAFRELCSNSIECWFDPMYAALDEGRVIMRTDAYMVPGEVAIQRRRLNVLSRFKIPTKCFVKLLPVLDRQFLLFEMELPALDDGDWEEIIKARFAVSKAKTKMRSGAGPRERFIRLIHNLEQSLDADYELPGPHMCDYIVLHRSHGFTDNRSAQRGFNPFAIVQELRRQNSIGRQRKGAVTLPARFSPCDLMIRIEYTYGTIASLINTLAEELLRGFGFSHQIDPANRILGPIVIFATMVTPHPPRLVFLPFRTEDLVIASMKAGMPSSFWDNSQIKPGDGWV